MKFLFDNNLSPHLAHAVRALSQHEGPRVGEVVALRDKFRANTPDEEWLTQLGTETGWNIISADNFRKTDVERELIRTAGFNVFVLQKSWSTHPFWPKSAQLVAWWPKILDQSERVSRSAVRVPWRLSGKFEQIRV